MIIIINSNDRTYINVDDSWQSLTMDSDQIRAHNTTVREERGEENLRRPQEPDGHVGDRLPVLVCQAGQRLANLRGPLLPGQGKFCL